MRTFWLAATATFAMTTVGANAQRVVAHGPAMRTGSMPRPMQHPAPMRPQTHAGWQGGHQVQKGGQWQGQGQVQHAGQWQHSSSSASSHSNSHSSVHVNVRPRWGARIGNRWWGGVRAPGGWGAYRRPVRGYALPSYWVSPNWLISDWGAYGLSQPPYGYNWSRYYDDAVLVDGRGSVYDTVGGIDWDGGDAAGGGYAEDQGGYADDGGYAEGGYQGGGYEQPGAPYPYPDHRDSGVGGAAIGAVVGGVAGNRIAGRGNRVAGTVIGAGVGAAAGYAIDRAEDRGPPPPPPYHQGAGYAPPPPMAVASGRPLVVQSGGYYSNGYYYPAPTVTTVTVTTTPVVTTTTEVFEDTVTYTRPARKVWRKRVVRARPRCTCS